MFSLSTMGALWLLAVAGIVLHALFAGWDQAKGEAVTHLIYTVAAPLIVWFALFLWELAAAPHRLLKDRVEKLEQKPENRSAAPPPPETSPDHVFGGMLLRFARTLSRIETTEILADPNAPFAQRRLAHADVWHRDLSIWARDLKMLGIGGAPELPTRVGHLLRWKQYLGKLRNYAMNLDLEGAQKWAATNPWGARAASIAEQPKDAGPSEELLQ